MCIYNSIKEVDIKKLQQEYIKAKPFPHLVIDDFLPNEFAQILENDCRKIYANINVSDGFQQNNKFTFNDWSLMPNSIMNSCAFFNSGNFLEFLESLTKIKGLVSDPYLEGGGLHQTKIGGFLKMHTDFNWHKKINLNRRINVILYLNSNYQKEWEGKLLLSNNPSKEEINDMYSIDPIFNRLIIFNTNDNTYHGHPLPLQFPENYHRTSLAFYYYTSKDRDSSEIKRFKTSTTRYMPTKNSRFKRTGIKIKSYIGYLLRRWTPFF